MRHAGFLPASLRSDPFVSSQRQRKAMPSLVFTILFHLFPEFCSSLVFQPGSLLRFCSSKQEPHEMASRSSNPVQASHPLNPTIQPFSMRARRRGIVGEFDRYFGSVNNLENWQRLCQDVGVDGDHSSITKCREVSNIRGSV